MNITKRCVLCDTALEFEQDGARLAFMAHDDAFCVAATRERIRMLQRALAGSAEDRAASEGKLHRRLLRQDVEMELLREVLVEAISHAPVAERASLRRRSDRGTEEWERRVRERIQRRREQEGLRLIELQRLAALPLDPPPKAAT